jgi:hypothetical protein
MRLFKHNNNIRYIIKMDELHLYTDEELANILTQYKKQRERVKKNYEKIKDTDQWKERNRANAKTYYHKHKDEFKERYQEDAEFNRARSSFYYYKKQNRLQDFMLKYPGRMETLINRDYFRDQNPFLSIVTPDNDSSSAEPSSSE